MICDILKSKRLDAIIISSKENLRYFSGFTGGEGLLIITPEKKTILIDGRYTVQAKQQAKGFEVVEFEASPYKLIADMRFDKIGFEDKSISYNSFKMLNRAMPAVTSIGISDDLSEARKIKTEQECINIRMAEKIGDMAFEHILKVVNTDMTEREVALELEYFMKRNGAEGLSFDTIVASGANSALPHAQPADKKIENNAFLLMDYGCVYNGYCSDMTRTVVVGSADDKMKNIYDTVLKAQLEAIKTVAPDVPNREVDAVARNIISDAGYEGCFNHSLGHGVGLEIHEAPNLSPRSEDILKVGNVVTVEPGVYIEDFGGVRIEDLLIVTENGSENMTHSPKDLIIL